MEYRELESSNLTEAAGLIWKVFSEFVGPGYSGEGVETFKKVIRVEELENSLQSGKIYMAGCFEGEKLVGVVSMRDFSHVSLLFVDKAYHGRGIARGLFAKALERCIREKPELCEITVNSSPYAVEAYKKLGFEAAGEQSTRDGITSTPLKMKVGPWQPSA